MAPVLLYHATPSKFVDDIKAGIKLDRAKPRTDFRRESQAFYLTDNEHIAKTVMTEEVRGFENHPTSVMTFSLELEGLKVKKFSNVLTGEALNEWREHVAYCRLYQKKGVPLPHPPPTVTGNYDVIIGWMSTRKGGQHEPVDSHVWQYAILTEHALSKLKFVKVE
ncbi:hypothetical protein BKA82DRAFT_31651 [Pisolithus tinctorius]|uniref:Uncharacterized protein n=1 Tax=Pisolithus tinctorius Marx 270 TaxID=870435 RepID=A0A0C3NS27_PISTI|nr:hypothetical protein BKA82DRAFT_31651 [Pisolithus tinctorius]KIN98093.1 hypothetical protein M404DRAFT_31651 [Pisolithus tinctorius Marx 270]